MAESTVFDLYVRAKRVEQLPAIGLHSRDRAILADIGHMIGVLVPDPTRLNPSILDIADDERLSKFPPEQSGGAVHRGGATDRYS